MLHTQLVAANSPPSLTSVSTHVPLHIVCTNTMGMTCSRSALHTFCVPVQPTTTTVLCLRAARTQYCLHLLRYSCECILPRWDLLRAPPEFPLRLFE